MSVHQLNVWSKQKEVLQREYDMWCEAPCVSVVCKELLDYCAAEQHNDYFTTQNTQSKKTNIFLKDAKDTQGNFFQNLIGTKKYKQSRDISKNIDKSLLKDRQDMKNSRSVLLFGCNNSGKTTLMKQIQRIHGVEFNVSNSRFLSRARQLCISELQRAVLRLTDRRKQHEPLKYLQECNIEKIFSDSEAMAQAKLLLDSLQASGDIRELYQYGVNPVIEWLIENLQRLKDDNFVPTIEEVLIVEPRLLSPLPIIPPSSSKPTDVSLPMMSATNDVTAQLSTDILMEIATHLDVKSICSLSKACKHFYKALNSDFVWERLLISDFASTNRSQNTSPKQFYQALYFQRYNKYGLQHFSFDYYSHKIQFNHLSSNSERRKWIHMFERVDALVFIVDMSQLVNLLYEDSHTYYIHECLMLFDEMINSRWWQEVSTVYVIFNKVELFENLNLVQRMSTVFSDWLPSDDWFQFLMTKFRNQQHSRQMVLFSKMNILDLQSVSKWLEEVSKDLTRPIVYTDYLD